MTYFKESIITEPLGSHGEILSVDRTPIIELKSAVPDVSSIRNNTSISGSGTIDVSGSEYQLSCTASGSDSAVLESSERGRYIPGYGAEAGIGIRVPTDQTYSGSQVARWGYFDDSNGFGFGMDSTGTFVFILRGGVETKTYQTNWNVDKVDGTGPSSLTLEETRGNIYHIRFIWYGYGTINYQMLIPDSSSAEGMRTVTVHRIESLENTSVEQPNLPLCVKIDNGGTASEQKLFVGGRQFSIVGKYIPNRRLTSEVRIGAPSGVGTSWVPIASFRRKTGMYSSQSVKMSTIELFTNADSFIGIFTGATLTGSSFGTPTDINENETVLESDVSATALSGGDLILRRLIKGSSSTTSRPLSRINIPGFDLSGNKPITIAIRSVSGTVTLESMVFEMQEDW